MVLLPPASSGSIACPLVDLESNNAPPELAACRHHLLKGHFKVGGAKRKLRALAMAVAAARKLYRAEDKLLEERLAGAVCLRSDDIHMDLGDIEALRLRLQVAL